MNLKRPILSFESWFFFRVFEIPEKPNSIQRKQY
jgi:hypothetical protein